MGTASETNGVQKPLVVLQSKDHEELLNIIDDLRSQGISRYVNLPQLIVCGDQSSGKSSVLEAVSGVRFPTKDNLCTRFATELILRRGPDINANVSIVPGADRSGAEKVKLLDFQYQNIKLEHFEAIVGDAKDAMGLDGDSKPFSNDILRVEVSGPNQPHLTLVDLPGLFQAGNRVQSDEDATVVRSLVLSYMKTPRSIILAVVSAKNDFANQIVTRYARELDPDGLRTLGIITKPDTLHAGSDSERSYFELAENKDVYFRLGWHVLKNRDYDSRDCSAEERDEGEREFFSHGVWTSLPAHHRGISSLKPRLSTLLKDQILAELPSLIEDVGSGVQDCEGILTKLGESRSTLQEQRLHLLRVSQEFSAIVRSAINGVYLDGFFGNAMTDAGYQKRLRAVIQNTLLDFADTIRRKGHAKQVIDETSKQKRNHPKSITRAEFVDEVLSLMKRSRGCELPGTYNPLIIGDLFYTQSKPWESHVERYTAKIIDATRKTLNLILEYTADESTRDGLLRHVINPSMEVLKKGLEDMTSTVLEPHQRGHPITYNHYLIDNIQKAKEAQRKAVLARKLDGFFGTNIQAGTTYCENRDFDVKILLDSLTQNTVADMDRYACSEAIECMQAYYKVAMKTFIDDFSVLGVEKCLLHPLPDMFSPKTVISLGDNLVMSIAAETEDSQIERTRTMEKLKVLRATLDILHSLDMHPLIVAKHASDPFENLPDIADSGEIDDANLNDVVEVLEPLEIAKPPVPISTNEILLVEERPFHFGERASIENGWSTNSALDLWSKGLNKTRGKKKKSAMYVPEVANDNDAE